MNDLDDLGRRSVLMTLGGDAATSIGDETVDFVPADEKYGIEGKLGAGGMGEVLLVGDRDLRRQIAMKVIRRDLADDPELRMKFVAEAQATSQLEHPGIPPVHDIGITPSGRVYFTMKLIRGKTLAEILDLIGWGPRRSLKLAEGWNFHRKVTVLERVAEALHFAHERGVIHRDVKPANIMLGEHGEVHVMDWGIARFAGRPDEGEVEAPVDTAGSDEALMTLDGTVMGTVLYMSPEQASGKVSTLDRRTDIYSLGVILYQLLTRVTPFRDEGVRTLQKVRAGDFLPVRERRPRWPMPDTLTDLCDRAMALDPEDRPATAAVFAAELRAWLDGSSEARQRHLEAKEIAARGDAAAERYRALLAEVREAEAEVAARATRYQPWQPVGQKRPLMRAKRRVEDLRSESARAFAEAITHLEGALIREEKNATARRLLADLWGSRLAEAELAGDPSERAYALEMIERYDDGNRDWILEGTGTLSLRTEPVPVEAFLYRYVERDGVLVPEGERALGTTPVEPIDLPMGSYLVVFRGEGFRETRNPVHIARNREWTGTVRMRTDEEIGEEFVYVPGGPFVIGEGRGAEVRELPDFAIARYPVTYAEYAEFLSVLSEEEAERRTPLYPPEGSDPRCPVVGISSGDAEAYCAFRSRETGREWRLPTEEEWEKAARGVDGRRFPWGDLADASLGKCRDSREEDPRPEPIGAFPTAASVYGMGDAAGNVWNCTGSWLDAGRSARGARGGSFQVSIERLGCAVRGRVGARHRDGAVGFRCARSFE